MLSRLRDKFRAFGWHVLEIDGHDMSAILAALARGRDHQGAADGDRGQNGQGERGLLLREQGILSRGHPQYEELPKALECLGEAL